MKKSRPTLLATLSLPLLLLIPCCVANAGAQRQKDQLKIKSD